MNIQIYDQTTDKLPVSKIFNEPTKKLPCVPKCVVEVRYDEERLLRSVKGECERQGFTWLPVAVFVSALVFWALAGCVISMNFYVILRMLSFW